MTRAINSAADPLLCDSSRLAPQALRPDADFLRRQLSAALLQGHIPARRFVFQSSP